MRIMEAQQTLPQNSRLAEPMRRPATSLEARVGEKRREITRKIEQPRRTWTTAEAAKGSGESERPWTKERPETPRSERTRRSRQSGHAPAAASGEQPIAGGWIGGAAAEFVGRMPLCCGPLRNAERTGWAAGLVRRSG